MSRRVTRLEARLDARLLQRTTRALHLTDAGRIYYSHARRMVEELDEAERAVAELSDEPAGTLRVTAPSDIGGRLAFLFAEFMAANPRVDIELSLTQRLVNLVEEGFDCAIRAGRLADSTLIARKLMSATGLHVYASPDYLQRHGTPADASELALHQCIVHSTHGRTVTWSIESADGPRSIKVRGRLAVDDFEVVRAATVAGVGLALMPDMLVGKDLRAGRLVRVLDGVGRSEDGVWFVYPSREHLPASVSALADFLKARFSEHVGCPEHADCPEIRGRSAAARPRGGS